MSRLKDARPATAGRADVAGPARATMLMDSPTSRDLGRTIRALRRVRRLTIEDLAFAADVHPTYLSAIEREERNPSWEKLRSLAHALGLRVAEVVQYAESEARIQRSIEQVLAEERLRKTPRDGSHHP